MKQFCITMSEEDIELFEAGRQALEMSKSAYVRLLIAEHEKCVPGFLKNKAIITKLSDISIDIRSLLFKDTLTDGEKLRLFTHQEQMEKLIQNALEK